MNQESSLYLNREFVALSATAFARSQAYSTILIALALYADLFQTTGTVEGLFGTAFAAAQLVVILPVGRYVDIGNAKRFLIFGLGVNVLVFIGFLFVSAVEHVIIMRVLQGLGTIIIWLTGTAVVGEISPEGSRGRWLGGYNQVTAISSLAGDVFGGLLLFVYGFEVTYVVLIVVTIFAATLVILFLRDNPGGNADPEDTSGLERLQTLVQQQSIQALMIFRAVFSVGKMTVILFLPIYARTAFGINPFAIGGILAGGKLTKALLQLKTGEFTDALGNRARFIAVGAVFFAIGTAIIPLAEFGSILFPSMAVQAIGHEMVLPPAFFVLFIAYAIVGIGDSIRLPASMALFVEEGEEFGAVGSSMSLREVVWKLGQVGGPVFIGTLWDLTSVFVAFWTSAGFILFATVLFIYLYTRER